MKDPNIVLKGQLITEKGTKLTEKENKYIFEVDRRANKIEIKNAIRQIFKVNVNKINIINQLGKMKRVRYKAGMTASVKKAIVSLKKGEKIEFK